MCVPIGATEIDKIVAFAQEQKVDYAVVAPDDPLVTGLRGRAGSRLESPASAPAPGPRIIEGSKVFSKNLDEKIRHPHRPV